MPDQVNVTEPFVDWDDPYKYDYSGIYADIMKLIAGIGHFKPIFKTFVIIEPEEEKGDGREGNLTEEDIKLRIDSSFDTNSKTLHLVRLVEKEYYFVIPQGELYTEWEKLFLPFDEATWLLIVMTFAAAFAVIIIISNFAPQFVKNFVFGRNITTPALNVLKIYFGLGQMVLPGRNFARFLLTLFTIWSLIFRTCYQGLLFEFLVGDGRKPAIKTIDELLERNFTYHTLRSHCNSLIGLNINGKGK